MQRRFGFSQSVLGGLLLAAGLLASDANAQTMVVCALGSSGGFNPLMNTPPTAVSLGVAQKVYTLLCPTGCGSLALYQNATTPNAMTMTMGTGSSQIVYSSMFMNAIADAYGDGAVFGIFAHEIGHHIDLNSSFPAMMSSSCSKELRADAWAGCAMARAKLPATQLKNSLTAIAAYPSPTHPAWPARQQAVDFGYTSCSPAPAVPAPTPVKPSAPTPPETPAPTPTPRKTDPCECRKKYDTCIAAIDTLEECVEDSVRGCTQTCQTKYGHTKSECVLDYCARTPKNMARWNELCATISEAETDDCDSEQRSCKSDCKK